MKCVVWKDIELLYCGNVPRNISWKKQWSSIKVYYMLWICIVVSCYRPLIWVFGSDSWSWKQHTSVVCLNSISLELYPLKTNVVNFELALILISLFLLVFLCRLNQNLTWQRGDKAMVLCFVEFTDAKCAITAMEALQGWIISQLILLTIL